MYNTPFTCEVFDLCTNPAVTTYNAGPGGEVLACESCLEEMQHLKILGVNIKPQATYL